MAERSGDTAFETEPCSKRPRAALAVIDNPDGALYLYAQDEFLSERGQVRLSQMGECYHELVAAGPRTFFVGKEKGGCHLVSRKFYCPYHPRFIDGFAAHGFAHSREPCLFGSIDFAVVDLRG